MSKKSLIIEQAALLFAKQSIEATSIEDITKACGISKGAFYLHFKSKNDLVDALLDFYFSEVINRFSTHVYTEDTSYKNIKKYFALCFDILEEKIPLILMYTNTFTPSTGTFKKIQQHTDTMQLTFKTILIDIYGERIRPYSNDLLLTVQGLVNSYVQYILTHPKKYNFNELTDVLAKRVDIILTHTTDWFIDDNFESLPRYDAITSELIIEEIHKCLLNDLLSNVQRDSLNFLLAEVQQSSPNEAIVLGMMHNIQNAIDLQWVHFLLRHYYSA